jgi:hypothetical protein
LEDTAVSAGRFANKDEHVVRQYVRELKLFYNELIVSGVVFFISLLAWMVTGGAFWPLWVLLALAIKILLRAISIGNISLADFGCFCKWASFLRPEWEDEQVEKLMREKKRKRGGRNTSQEDEDEDYLSDVYGAVADTVFGDLDGDSEDSRNDQSGGGTGYKAKSDGRSRPHKTPPHGPRKK